MENTLNVCNISEKEFLHFYYKTYNEIIYYEDKQGYLNDFYL